jgi:hypothetical protein
MTYRDEEAALAASTEDELPAYAVTDAASETLRWVIQRTPIMPDERENPPPSYWRAKALMYLGVLAVRTTRAALTVLRAGYEAEAMTYKRTLMEVHSRVRLVVADPSGEYARQWLLGRAGKPAKAVGGFSPDDFWTMLSHSTHADHRAVENFLAVSEPDGTTRLLVAPERRQVVSNATLATFAGETRDVANVIATERGLEIPDLAALDDAISEHFPWAEGSGPSGTAAP